MHLGRGTRWIGVGLIALAGMSVDGAEAQTGGEPPPQATPATDLTFATPVRNIVGRVSTDIVYDSNVPRRAASANLRGLKAEDVRFSPAAELTLTLPRAGTVFTLNGRAGYDFYARNSQLNRERINVDGGVQLKAGPCSVSADANYARRQSDLINLSIDPVIGDGDAVNVQTIRSIGANADCGPPVGLRPTAFASYTEADNSSVVRQLQDVDTWTYGGGLAYSNPAFGVLTGFVSRSDFKFERRDIGPVLIGAQDFSVTSAGISLDRRLGARLQVRGQVSYANVATPIALNDGSFDGLNWTLAASLRASDRVRVELDLSRAIEVPTGLTANFAKATSYGGSVTYVLSPLMRVTAAGSRRSRDLEITLLAPTIQFTEDTIDDVSARLSYLWNRLTINLIAGYQRRDADVAIYRYSAARLTVGASYRFGR